MGIKCVIKNKTLQRAINTYDLSILIDGGACWGLLFKHTNKYIVDIRNPVVRKKKKKNVKRIKIINIHSHGILYSIPNAI